MDDRVLAVITDLMVRAEEHDAGQPDEIAPFAALLAGSPGLTVTTVEVGKGELVAVRDPEPADRPSP